jgi:hypothetical protein
MATMKNDLRERIAARKRAEIEQKLAGIRLEFAHWIAEAGAGKPLRKHQSQIQRLTDQLGGMVDRVAKKVSAVPAEGDNLLSGSRSMQLRILEVHRLWDYYRSKLSLRYVTSFADYLAAADDLAWECYEPARRAARSAPQQLVVRAAPLVFLTGEFSPYTHARAGHYEVESLPDVLDSEEFLAVAAALPVPVIGVPWYQVSHLPDAPLIGHEIGHDLEAELALTETMQEHLTPVLDGLECEERSVAWDAWRSEIFADLYGLLCTGPAFVASMTDLLAADPVEIADQAQIAAAWLPHPPAAVRMYVMTHALTLQGFGDEGAALWRAWETVFPLHAQNKFLGDVPAIVKALWNGVYPELGQRSLPDAHSFTVQQQEFAVAVKDSVLAGRPPQINDIRCLIAAARLAFDADPHAYHCRPRPDKNTAQELILNHILSLRDNAPRFGELASSPDPEADRAAGEALLERLERTIDARAAGIPADGD